jgi:hypothetical protein
MVVHDRVLVEKFRIIRVMARNHLEKNGEQWNAEQVDYERSCKRASGKTTREKGNLSEQFDGNIFEVCWIEGEKLLKQVFPIKTIKALGRKEVRGAWGNRGLVNWPSRLTGNE